MANKILEGKILHVVKTTSQWASESTVVTKGLLCVEFTDDGKTRLKIGDGLNTFSKLVYCDGNVDLSNYYTKSETSDVISEAITAIGTVMTIKGTVNSFSDLPTGGNTAGDVYFVVNDNITVADGYAEYVWVVPSSGNARWEYIGTVAQDVDLSGYATITYVDSEIAKLTALAHSHSNKTILDNTTASFTTEQATKLSGIATGAEVNQNAFSNVVVGDVTITADSKTDTISFVAGTNVNITADATNDKVTISAEDTDLKARVQAIEDDYIKSTDTIVINCTL